MHVCPNSSAVMIYLFPRLPYYETTPDSWISCCHRWTDYLFGICLDDGAGLIPPEMLYFLSTLPEDASNQGPLNTILMEGPSLISSTRKTASDGMHVSSSRGFKEDNHQHRHDPALLDAVSKNMTVSDFLAVTGGHSSQPVIYLDFIPLIDEPLDPRFNNRLRPLDQCWALTLF